MMYTTIASTLQADVGGEKMGISKAASLLANPDGALRLAAWNGVQQVTRDRQSEHERASTRERERARARARSSVRESERERVKLSRC